MRLSRLISAVSARRATADPTRAVGNAVSGADPDIRSIHYHSATVRPGGLFVAVPGLAADGHNYIANAVQQGAAAVIAQRSAAAGVPVILVDNSRTALAETAALFHGHPSRRLFITGVTGTNGKTTTTYLLESMLAGGGEAVGVIGTVNYRFGGRIFPNPVTTPESLDLQRILARMAAAAVRHVVMEISSHAIELERLHTCRLPLGVFTNLTQDHLDFHGDMQHYWACKQRLFTELMPAGCKPRQPAAVVNMDNPYGRELARLLPYTVIGVGRDPDLPVRPLNVQIDLNGIRGTLATPAGGIDFNSRLVGAHNLENILCAAGAAMALALPAAAVRAGIEATRAVPGRLERVPDDRGRFVYVDYAHTPDALQQVLNALNRLKKKRLICVFGCGGDRDRRKRPIMGAIAMQGADLAIVTSDNPRSENPLDIITQVVEGIRRVQPRAVRREDAAAGGFQKSYLVEPDRRSAIAAGIHAARAGDIVLIAGKGHETYQIIGGRTLCFDDRRVAADFLRMNAPQTVPPAAAVDA